MKTKALSTWEDKISVIIPFVNVGYPVICILRSTNEMAAWNNCIILFGLFMTWFGTFICKQATLLLTDKLDKEQKRIIMRPDNATNCNIFANNGHVGNSPGLPSGHSATSTFFALVVILGPILQSTNKDYTWYMNFKHLISYCVALIIIYGTGKARISKACHTPLQVMLGTLWGSAFGLFMVSTMRF